MGRAQAISKGGGGLHVRLVSHIQYGHLIWNLLKDFEEALSAN
jgi:hypothetical protein